MIRCPSSTTILPPLATACCLLLLITAAFGEARAESSGEPPIAEIQALLEGKRFEAAMDASRAWLVQADSTDLLGIARLKDLLVEALWKSGNPRDPEALVLAQESIGVKEALVGPDSDEAAHTLRLLGVIHSERGEYAEARVMLERALEIRSKLFGEMDVKVADVLQNLGTNEILEGDFRRALVHLERARQIRETLLPPDDETVGDVMNGLGVVHYRLGNYAEAEPHWKRALSVYERSLGPEHERVGQIANNLGLLLVAQGKPEEARAFYEQALRITERTLGPEHPNAASILLNLGNLERDLRKHQVAEALYDRALAIREGGDAPNELAFVLSNYGWLRLYQGRFREGEAMCRRALEIREAALGPENFYLMYDLRSLAKMLERGGDFDAALTMYERALALAEANLPASSPVIAEILSFLAWARQLTGDYRGAIVSYERMSEIYRASFGERSARLGHQLEDYGTLLKRLGDRHGALAKYLEAESIFREVYDANDARLAALLTNAAMELIELGRIEEARRNLEESTRIYDSNPEFDARERIRPVEGLGYLHLVSARWETATSYFSEAIAVRKELEEDPLGLAALYRLMGRSLMFAGSVDDAGPYFEYALDTYDRTLGPKHPRYAAALMERSALEWLRGDVDAGIEDALESEEISRNHLLLATRALPERQALLYATSRSSGLNQALTFVVNHEDGGQRRDTLDALIRSRAIVLDEMGARNRAIADAKGVADLAHELATAQRRLANLVVRGSDDDDPGAYRAILEEARAEKEAAERELAEASANFGERRGRSDIGLREVRAHLPQGSALVSFVLYRRLLDRAEHDRILAAVTDEEERWKKRLPFQSTYLAFVLRSDARNPAVIPIGGAQEIDRSIESWQRAVTSPGREQTPGVDDLDTFYREAAADVRARVLDPLATHLDGLDRVFLVPDGALHRLNFDTLPRTDDSYVLESGPLLQYLSAERDLVQASPVARAPGMLAVGGVDYDQTPGVTTLEGAAVAMNRDGSISGLRGKTSNCVEFQDLHFEFLPGSAAEATAVVDRWQQTPAARNQPLLTLRGAEANESALVENMGRYGIVHLATHGFFLGQNCITPGLDARGVGELVGGNAAGVPDSPSSAHADESTGPGAAQFRLSGLALAGANNRHDTGDADFDGILTAEEVTSIDMSGVDLIVLSACETGLGEVVGREGVFGLRRAIQAAGARSLVTSLWSVDDSATRDWMESFYRHYLLEARSPAEAGREAERDVLERRRSRGESTHPFYWGAFVVAGRDR